MKDNKEIFNEAFFKKASYDEIKNKRLPQYQPVSNRDSKEFGGTSAFAVTDANEVKKRLASSFGAAFGNNNVRSLASRAIKEFPIIVSDKVQPETVIMLKKVLEEQYAEYINLLASNKVLNLADYSAGDDTGNIAIQAVDSMTGTSDFSNSRIADVALRNKEINSDSIFQNLPLYSLLRESHEALSVGDTLIDSLLENAVILPDEQVPTFVSYIQENADSLLEWVPSKDPYPDPPFRDPAPKRKTETEILSSEIEADVRRGFLGLDKDGKEIYNKLTTGDIVLDKKRLGAAINKSVGEILTMPGNEVLKDKFEKATFLLQSRQIAGIEYYQYLTQRLGIPVSDAARQELITEYKIKDLIRTGGGVDAAGKLKLGISDSELKDIANNRVHVEKTVSTILQTKLSVILTGVGVTLGAAGVGYLISTLAKTAPMVIATLTTSPLFWPVIASVVVGGGYLIKSLIQKNKKKKALADLEASNKLKINGWERVEFLIQQMEKQQAEVIGTVSNDTNRYANPAINIRPWLKS